MKRGFDFMEKKNFEVWVGHLGAYSTGYIVGKWIELPQETEKIQSELEDLWHRAVDDCGEYGTDFYIDDWELPFEIEENTSVYRINEMIILTGGFTEEDYILLKCFLNEGLDFEDAVEKVNRERHV